jgi:thermitase
MKGKILSLAIVMTMVLGSFGAVVNLKAEGTNELKEYVPGEVIVGFYETIDVGTIDSFKGHSIKEKIEVLNTAVVEVDEGMEQVFIDSVAGSSLVKYAEPNWIVHAWYTPNDPLWNQQWGPKRIHCEKAWDGGTGSSSVKIAIVDTGIDYNHEDIVGNYVSGGHDWVNEDNDPMDDNNHGTHCAGIAAAVMDNSKGIAGVAQVKVMAEKVLGSGGSGSSSDVASGITHAANNGANIISMSLGSSSPSSVIEDACDYAYNTKDVVLVAASGNDGQPQVSYPAAFETVIAVGAIDTNDERCDFSNYGEDLELMAPGYRVVSSIPGNNYDFYSGTSMACPHVAGVAALVKSLYPSENNVWIRQKLVDTAEDLGPAGWDEEYGYGLVDASLGGGGPGNWPKVTIQIYQLENIDPIEWITGGEAEWYYQVSVGDESTFEYNGQDQEILPGWWIFNWNSQNVWTPDKNYDFNAKNLEVEVKIKLMEHDGILEGGSDDLADVSAYPGGGTDNSIEDVRGAIYHGTYNLVTNQLTGDQVGLEGNYYTTNGEDDGSTSTDENDAKIWFKISDNYEAPGKPNRPSGPAQGRPGTEYTYITSMIDPGVNQVYYKWDWGDGELSDWLGPYNPSATAEASHTWMQKGSFQIKVKAKDVYDVESEWSDPLVVRMPITISFNSLLFKFLERINEQFPQFERMLITR